MFVCKIERKEDCDLMPNNHLRQHKYKVVNLLNIYPTIRENQRQDPNPEQQNPPDRFFKEISVKGEWNNELIHQSAN